MDRNNRESMELILPSRMDYLSIVNRVSEEVADQVGMDEDAKNAVATAVIEAATNAMQHGNRGDASKKVRITFIVTPKTLEVVVKDQGRGFNPSMVPDPREPENLLRERGRGIFIIRSFMDEVQFVNRGKGGMVVRLIKRLDQLPAKDSAGG